MADSILLAGQLQEVGGMALQDPLTSSMAFTCFRQDICAAVKTTKFCVLEHIDTTLQNLGSCLACNSSSTGLPEFLMLMLAADDACTYTCRFC